MRKIIPYFLILLMLSIGCEKGESMFKRHVINEASASESIKNMHYGKVACMSCPMYFKLQATDSLVSKIIKQHELKEIKTIPDYIKRLNEIINSEEDWWIKKPDSSNVHIYYFSKSGPSPNPAYRIMFVDDNNIFFITKGYFE